MTVFAGVDLVIVAKALAVAVALGCAAGCVHWWMWVPARKIQARPIDHPVYGATHHMPCPACEGTYAAECSLCDGFGTVQVDDPREGVGT